MYIEKITPWKSNKWIAPPPHEIARIRKAAGTHEGDEENARVDADALEKEDRGPSEEVNKETT
jgi:hypothetical protein